MVYLLATSAFGPRLERNWSLAGLPIFYTTRTNGTTETRWARITNNTAEYTGSSGLVLVVLGEARHRLPLQGCNAELDETIQTIQTLFRRLLVTNLLISYQVRRTSSSTIVHVSLYGVVSMYR